MNVEARERGEGEEGADCDEGDHWAEGLKVVDVLLLSVALADDARAMYDEATVGVELVSKCPVGAHYECVGGDVATVDHCPALEIA